MRTRALASFLGVALCAGLAAFFIWPSDAPGLSSTCESVERNAYPQLEAEATHVVGDLADKTSQLSDCEETGQPGPSVAVSVYDWASNKQTRAHLLAAGLMPMKGTYKLRSPDGVYEVGYFSIVDELENAGRKFMTIRFELTG